MTFGNPEKLKTDFFTKDTATGIKAVGPLLLTTFLLLFPLSSAAQPPLYEAEYDARYKGIRARATMAVTEVTDTRYRFDSQMFVSLFGKRLVGVDELSIFTWDAEAGTAIPDSYLYEQTGIGGRTRTARFKHEEQTLLLVPDEDEAPYSIPMLENTQDRLTMYFEIKKQLEAGAEDIYINILDKTRIENEHYRKVSEEVLQTPLGRFNAIQIEKVREPDSQRKTILWVASDWDYILLKLEQYEPDGDSFEINLNEATTPAGPVTGLSEQAAD